MSISPGADGPVHYPKRRDVFQFDDEVAAIFDDMAPRSIPMYNEVHRLHVSLFSPWFVPGSVIVDVGSSTGHLFRNIERLLCKRFHETGMEGVALDRSGAMMDRLAVEFPTVRCQVEDITTAPPLKKKATVMFCLYLTQFVSPEDKGLAYSWIADNLAPGGIVVLGQKEAMWGQFAEDLFSREYHLFRRDNGYTQEEIDAKTAALKNSMWPITEGELVGAFLSHGIELFPTTRWLQFSTMVGLRR